MLGQVIARGDLSLDQLEVAGRYLLKAGSGGESVVPIRVLVLGECSTQRIKEHLTALAWGQGLHLAVEEGSFDNVHQHLNQLVAGQGTVPDVLVLLAWAKGELDSGDAGRRRPTDIGSFWAQAWALASSAGITRIVQVGYDWVPDGLVGPSVIRAFNAALVEGLPRGACLVLPDSFSGILGRERCYDERNYSWMRGPYTTEGIVALSRALLAGVRALTVGPKKVLVLDLDDTLWGGVVGEVGVAGIAVGTSPEGETYSRFQAHLKALTERGVLLAACSKNNIEDARAPFREHPGMVLRLPDFASFRANWRAKAENLREMAEELRIGLDAFVFFDDNPAERDQMRHLLPEVAVVDVPPDPSGYRRALAEGGWFALGPSTPEDALRNDHYRVEQVRREAAAKEASLEDHLAALAMVGRVAPVDANALQRAVQLVNKTNQFNLTTRRHSLESFSSLVAQPGALTLALNLKDRFGDYGMIGLAVGVPELAIGQGVLRMDMFLLSCRAIGRTAEHFLFNQFCHTARSHGWIKLVAEYLPTPKNGQVAGLWESFGLVPVSGAGLERRFQLELADWCDLTTFVDEGTVQSGPW